MKNWKNTPKTKWIGFVGMGAMVVVPVAAAVSCSSSISEPNITKVDPKNGDTKNRNNLLQVQPETQKVYYYELKNIDTGEIVAEHKFLDKAKAINFAEIHEKQKIEQETKYRYNGVVYDTMEALNKDFDAKLDSIKIQDLMQSGDVTLRVASREGDLHDPHSNGKNRLMFMYNNRVYGSYLWVAQAWSLDHPDQTHTPELQTSWISDSDSINVRISYSDSNWGELQNAKENGVALSDIALVVSPFPPSYVWTIKHPYYPGHFNSYTTQAELLKVISEWIRGDNGNSKTDPYVKINGWKYGNEFYIDKKTAEAIAKENAQTLIEKSEKEINIVDINFDEIDL